MISLLHVTKFIHAFHPAASEGDYTIGLMIRFHGGIAGARELRARQLSLIPLCLASLNQTGSAQQFDP